MRYDDWDVLLFPTGRNSKVPFKEFKVACHVVPDVELSHTHGSLGLPVMTCFVPGLTAGTPFHISIHSWREPEISQYTRTYSKHAELAKLEARVLIDGRMVASASFDRKSTYPHLLYSTFEFMKNGELEPLKFPHFRRELLYQNHWNPGDDIGRIKVLISEGFPRDSLSVPIERVKNIVAFSFQHAPLDILESNGIAWPNPMMWRRPLLNGSSPIPTYHPDEGAESHAHSPRRRSMMLRSGATQAFPMSMIPPVMSFQPTGFSNTAAFPHQMPLLARSGTSSGSSCPDPFTDPAAYFEWLSQLNGGQMCDPGGKAGWPASFRNSSKQSSDTSMPDYNPNHCVQNGMIVDPVLNMVGMGMEEETTFQHLKVPTNTPTGPLTTGVSAGEPSFSFPVSQATNSLIGQELATSLTHSLLNQPMPLPVQPQSIPLPASEVKSRKENRHLNNVNMSTPSSTASTPHAEVFETRKVSQPVLGLGSIGAVAPLVPSNAPSRTGSPASQGAAAAVFSASTSRTASGGGEFGANLSSLATSTLPLSDSTNAAMISGADKSNKRTRTFTPASARAIDDEDEPRRLSPRLRVPTFVADSALDGE